MPVVQNVALWDAPSMYKRLCSWTSTARPCPSPTKVIFVKYTSPPWSHITCVPFLSTPGSSTYRLDIQTWEFSIDSVTWRKSCRTTMRHCREAVSRGGSRNKRSGGGLVQLPCMPSSRHVHANVNVNNLHEALSTTPPEIHTHDEGDLHMCTYLDLLTSILYSKVGVTRRKEHQAWPRDQT